MGRPGCKPGHTNNPNGRPPDAKVKLYRDSIREKQIERIKKLYQELDKLEGKDYVELYIKISKDIFPALPAEVEPEQAERAIMSIFEAVNEKLAKSKDQLLKAG